MVVTAVNNTTARTFDGVVRVTRISNYINLTCAGPLARIGIYVNCEKDAIKMPSVHLGFNEIAEFGGVRT